MKRNLELKYLLIVLILIFFGFLLVYSSFVDRGISPVLRTTGGPIDISDFFLTPYPNSFYGLFFVAAFLMAHLYLRVSVPDADPFILPVVALLSGVGAIMLLRLSPELASSRNDAILSLLNRHPDARVTDNILVLAQLGMRHFVFVIAGVLLMVVSTSLFTRRVFSWLSSKKYVWVLLSAALIIITLKFGTTINGRRLWLFGFQSVEAVKVFMLFFIAGYIYDRGREITLANRCGIRSWLSYAGPFVVMWGFSLVPIFVQRDLGPTFVIFILFLLMFHYAGNPGTATAVFVLLTVAMGYVSYAYGYPSVVQERFDILLDPFGRSENMARVLWSMASGGFFGEGIGYGQPYRIPVVQSDFSFTAICEEMGFMGGTAIVLAYAVLLQRCYSIVLRTENLHRKALAAGIGVLTGVQAFIMILGNLCVIPVTGLTLPLVSYGGSSMLINFFIAGLLMRISGQAGKSEGAG